MSDISEYDYSKTTELVKSYLPSGYKGNVFRLSYSWQIIIPITNEPIKIMEIGTYHGANICSYMKTYTHHNETQIHSVYPYIDYNGYNEYMSKQPSNYSIFLNNISKLDPIDLNNIYIHCGLSEDIVPLFPNDSFDIICIDGNHDKKYALEDAVLCFKKLKLDGWMNFDDMLFKEDSDAVHVFLTIYSPFFEIFKIDNAQLFIKRKTE